MGLECMEWRNAPYVTPDDGANVSGLQHKRRQGQRNHPGQSRVMGGRVMTMYKDDDHFRVAAPVGRAG